MDNYFVLVVDDEKEIRDDYCSDENSLRVQLKATVPQTYYDANGDWLTSFSLSPADC